MEYKDVSPDIASISQAYFTHRLPPWLLRAQELLQQIWLWIQELLNTIFRTRNPGAGDSSTLSTLLQYGLYFAGAIALLAIAYLLWRRVVSRQAKLAGTKRGAAAVEKILDSHGYKLDAERLATAGDYKGACRALYLSLLQLMHEQNIATFAPAKTNYEYRYLLKSYASLQKGFVEIADMVEELWFGNKQAANNEYTECLKLLANSGLEVERIGAERAKIKTESEP